VGADDIRIEVIAPHAKGQPSLKLALWPGTRNGRKGFSIFRFPLNFPPFRGVLGDLA
jgi:hypothetical protein